MQRSLLWAPIYDNYENQHNLSTSAILEQEQTYPVVRTKSVVNTPNASISKNYLETYPSHSIISTLALMLGFFDSRGGVEYQRLNNKTNSIVLREH